MCSSAWPIPAGVDVDDIGYRSTDGFPEPFTLTSTGTWSVYLDGYQDTIGTATLTVYLVPANAVSTIVTGGAVATVATTVITQNGRMTFSGSVGTTVTNEVTAASGGWANGNVFVSLLRPDGSDASELGWGYAGTTFSTFTLDANGTWTMFLDGYLLNVGGVTVKLS